MRLSRLVGLSLAEDRARHDVTSRTLFNSALRIDARIICKQDSAILAGTAAATEVFKQVDARIRVRFLAEGSQLKRGQVVCRLSGSAIGILAAERTALNFLGHLSGVATLTRRFVDRVKGRCMVSDTRKTTPLLRDLEKAAVATGGGIPHRRDLSTMAMIKDNHLAILRRQHGRHFAAALSSLCRKLKSKGVEVEVEVDDMEVLTAALAARADWLMLDNMDGARLKNALRRIAGYRPRPKVEVSGGVDLAAVPALARLGIERVSVGALTHSAACVDFSLRAI